MNKKEKGWEKGLDTVLMDNSHMGGIISVEPIKKFIQQEIDRAREEGQFTYKELKEIKVAIQTTECFLKEEEKLEEKVEGLLDKLTI